MEGEILYQWHVDPSEYKLNEQYVGRETACSPDTKIDFAKSGDDVSSQWLLSGESDDDTYMFYPMEATMA